MHAVSVALPRWRDVVGYEEKFPEVTARLTSGYPRFVIHPVIQEVARQFTASGFCLPFPALEVAVQAASFVHRTTGQPVTTENVRGLSGVITTEAGFPALKAFWQHTGLILSTRQAESWLQGRGPGPHSADPRLELRQTLASLYDCSVADVFLAPTGMAAQYAALRAVMARSPSQPTVQLGFPYVDTLKLQQKLGHGGILLHHLESIGPELENLLEKEAVAACFGEIPGNPLLGSADLRQITPLLRKHRVPFIADDVVATPYNVDLGGHADLIATSLTKFIVGTAEAMGGALICNPRSPLYNELQPVVASLHKDWLWPDDAAVLASEAEGFPARMEQHNRNGLFIAEKLKAHPAIEKIWYPKWEFNQAYEAVRRPAGGYGALVTFLPRNAETTSPLIYDRMEISKGPSLGTVFSLACPFTLLAHYTELDWAEACGVSRFLIRLSVGLEDPAELWSRLKRALPPA
jgi:cystathionine gamma-synthase